MEKDRAQKVLEMLKQGYRQAGNLSFVRAETCHTCGNPVKRTYVYSQRDVCKDLYLCRACSELTRKLIVAAKALKETGR